jgi:hypothetical protein
MRTREEIENKPYPHSKFVQEYHDYRYSPGVILEVLLDIRDLLIEAKEKVEP